MANPTPAQVAQAREIARHFVRKGPMADGDVEGLTGAIAALVATAHAEGRQAERETRDVIADLVDVCYVEGSSPSWRLCLGCETEHHREHDSWQHGKPDCPVAAAEKWLTAWQRQLATEARS